MREIPPEQVQRRLTQDNPWWLKEAVLAEADRTWRPRPYLDLFLPLLDPKTPRRAVVLMGPRRVGKTVLLHHAIERLLASGVDPKSILYASVDHPLYNGLSLGDFIAAFSAATGKDPRTDPCFLFFDEIQYLRDWEIHLKALVDDLPNSRCVVSGSAAAALRLKSVESGAGRFTDFLLPPLTFHEFIELQDLSGLIEPGPSDGWATSKNIELVNEQFLRYLNYGGYPEAVFQEEVRKDVGRFIKNDIIDRVLLRDLPSLYGIQDIQELNYLFTTLAYNTADEVSPEGLSKKSGVAKNTILRYVAYLEAAFLIRIVHRIDRDGRRFQRARQFKVYLTNPSMRAALFSPIGADDQEAGSLVETAIFSQWFHSDSELFYARWKTGEVDLVNLGRSGYGPLWAVEAKWSDRALDDPREIAGLLRFAHENSLESVLVTTRTMSDLRAVDGVGVQFIPSCLYCYTVSRNLVQGKAGAPTAHTRRLD